MVVQHQFLCQCRKEEREVGMRIQCALCGTELISTKGHVPVEATNRIVFACGYHYAHDRVPVPTELLGMDSVHLKARAG